MEILQNVIFKEGDIKIKKNAHHGRDTDENQGAAQVGVLVFLRLAVGIVHNLQDQFLLQVAAK